MEILGGNTTPDSEYGDGLLDANGGSHVPAVGSAGGVIANSSAAKPILIFLVALAAMIAGIVVSSSMRDANAPVPEATPTATTSTVHAAPVLPVIPSLSASATPSVSVSASSPVVTATTAVDWLAEIESRGTAGPARALFAHGTYGTYQLSYIVDTSSTTHPTETASDYVFIIYEDGGAALGYWSESYYGFEARFDCGGWSNILTGDGQSLAVDNPETVLEFGEVVGAVCPSADLAASGFGKV